MPKYNPKDVVITWNGVPIDGFATAQEIKVLPNETISNDVDNQEEDNNNE